jgi:hypothetical protein
MTILAFPSRGRRARHVAAIAVVAGLWASLAGASWAQDADLSPEASLLRFAAYAGAISQPESLLPNQSVIPVNEPAHRLTVDVTPRDSEIPITLDPLRPTDSAKARFAGEPSIFIEGSLRDCDLVSSGLLQPAQFCHSPLYFDDDPLERYGCCHAHCQVGASAFHFFGGVLALPIKMYAQPHRSLVLTPNPLH